MAKFKVVENKTKMSLEEIVEYQIMMYAYFNDINISKSDIKCLSMLIEEYSLVDYCNKVIKKGYLKSNQSVRNSVSRLSNIGLIQKIGNNKKQYIKLSDKLNVISEGNIMLNFKLYYIETNNI